MSRHPFIHPRGRFLFFLLAAILPAQLPPPVFAEAFPPGSFISQPPEQRARPNPAPGQPLVKPGKGIFLIAGKNLHHPNFLQTVVLLIDHSPEGAMGVVINRPSGMKLSSLFPDMENLKNRSDELHMGGPVSGDGLILLFKTRKEPEGAVHVFEDVYAGGKPEDIVGMLDRADPKERFRVYMGYSGWGPGQLEQEIARGSWHLVRADIATIFDKENSKIWPELILPFSSQCVRHSPYRQDLRGMWSPGT